MYIWISRSASSWARYSSCATIRLATVSSMGVPRNTMRFFSSSEKMSYTRSPRLVCSTTIGTAYEVTRVSSSSLLIPRLFRPGLRLELDLDLEIIRPLAPVPRRWQYSAQYRSLPPLVQAFLQPARDWPRRCRDGRWWWPTQQVGSSPCARG